MLLNGQEVRSWTLADPKKIKRQGAHKKVKNSQLYVVLPKLNGLLCARLQLDLNQ